MTPDYYIVAKERYIEIDLIPWDSLFQINESLHYLIQKQMRKIKPYRAFRAFEITLIK